ncbi:cap-binding protein [Desulforamulus profundi]|uniref:Cap-binding protein n=1 Tax=Desulforamulus profundi TaxID=1383067 RepID=A0A2C6MF34_9FIRM|nr:cap-binding protein [Desulforamulus profundi]MCL5780289.1 cap-binding protein [Bacillota bacterium]PHJ38758.1 cap-binding protein [Desulforamulus profundi]
MASLQECLKKWEKSTIIYLHYIQGMSSNEYNNGFADGLEMALKSFQEHVKECPDYQITGEVEVE